MTPAERRRVMVAALVTAFLVGILTGPVDLPWAGWHL